MKHDIAIIGGGSAGYAAARTAHETGANGAVIDHGPWGGLCILRGCMPSKAILRSAEIAAHLERAAEFGLAPVEVSADLSAIIDRKARLIGEFADYRREQLHDGRFTLYEQRASFLTPQTLQVGDQVLEADRFIIATGSSIRHVSIPGLDQAGYITSDEALELREQPESMIVLGGGPIAADLAQFFQRIGTEVKLIQRSHHILSTGDEDLARPVEERFRAEGMEVYTATQLHKFTRDKDGPATAHFSQNGEEKTASGHVILQALGRRPNTEGLDLDKAGVETNHGRIVVDGAMRTNQPHIYAVGDVNGEHEIVHIAVEQGEIAAYNATHPDRPEHRFDERLNTLVVFTDPQIASVGLCEKDCQNQDLPYLVGIHPFDDHGKSMTMGETLGHVKILCNPGSGEILGAHIVGPQAGELIHELVAIMYFRGTVHDLAKIPHYHPTLAEILTYPAEELAEQL